METKKITSKKYFNLLRIIHFSFTIGLLLCSSFVIFLFKSLSVEKDNSLTNIFFPISLIMLIFGLVGNSYIFKLELKAAKKHSDLYDKTQAYKSALVNKFKIIGGPTLFTIVVILLTGNLIILGFTGLLIATLIVNKPSISKTCKELELDHEETNKLNNPNTILAEIHILS